MAYTAIGLLELNSIAKGIEASDAMVKAAEVELVTSHSVCPGKFVVLIAGDVAAVTCAVQAGEPVSLGFIVDRFVIPNIHPEVFPAITATSGVETLQALGVIETFSVASTILASDAAAKAASIKLIEIRLANGIGGKSFVTLTGTVADVRAAVEAGAEMAKSGGLLVSYVVIPQPHPDLKRFTV